MGEFDFETLEDQVARENSVWVPISDQLPPKPGRYIFGSVTSGWVREGEYVDHGYYLTRFLVDGYRKMAVTHWMPLPAPPMRTPPEQCDG